MRVRFTATAADELESAITNFLQHAPHVAANFADSVDEATRTLREHPYSSAETEMPAVRRKYIRRFHYVLFYRIDERAGEVEGHAARRRPWEADDEHKEA
jgi:plasmid stabilization system protein ParE